jgi:hypothetical protein
VGRPMKVTVTNIPRRLDNTLYHFVLEALNHLDLDVRITGAAPKLDAITPY